MYAISIDIKFNKVTNNYPKVNVNINSSTIYLTIFYSSKGCTIWRKTAKIAFLVAPAGMPDRQM